MHAYRRRPLCVLCNDGFEEPADFLELLRAGRDEYIINRAALDYMREHKLPQATITRFGDAEQRFAGRKADKGNEFLGRVRQDARDRRSEPQLYYVLAS